MSDIEDKTGFDVLDDFLRRRTFSNALKKPSTPLNGEGIEKFMRELNECDDNGMGAQSKNVVASRLIKVLSDDELLTWVSIAADTVAYAGEKPKSDERKLINAGREISIAMQDDSNLSARMSRENSPMEDMTAVKIMNASASVYGAERFDGMRLGQAAILMSTLNADSPVLASAALGEAPWSNTDTEMAQLRIKGRLAPIAENSTSWAAIVYNENGKASLMGFQGKVTRPEDFRNGEHDITPAKMTERSIPLNTAPKMR